MERLTETCHSVDDFAKWNSNSMQLWRRFKVPHTSFLRVLWNVRCRRYFPTSATKYWLMRTVTFCCVLDHEAGSWWAMSVSISLSEHWDLNWSYSTRVRDRDDFCLVGAGRAQLATRVRLDSLSGTAPPSTAVRARVLGLGRCRLSVFFV